MDNLKTFKTDPLNDVREQACRIRNAMVEAKQLGNRLDQLGIKHDLQVTVRRCHNKLSELNQILVDAQAPEVKNA